MERLDDGGTRAVVPGCRPVVVRVGVGGTRSGGCALVVAIMSGDDTTWRMGVLSGGDTCNKARPL